MKEEPTLSLLPVTANFTYLFPPSNGRKNSGMAIVLLHVMSSLDGFVAPERNGDGHAINPGYKNWMATGQPKAVNEHIENAPKYVQLSLSRSWPLFRA